MTSTTTAPEAPPTRGWVSTSRKAPSVADVSRVTVLTAMALVVLVPIVWTFLSSFKSTSELAERPPSLFPDSLSLSNYTEALASFNFTVYLRNSVIVVVGATVLTLVINSMAAYALAKYNFRGRNALFLLTLATIMIPLQVILIPVYLVTAQLGLVNTLWGLIIPAAATPTGVFVLRQYMLTIPDELIEAARVDGAGEFRIFWRIILPLSKPALAVVAIFSVVWRWNDFLWPLIIAQDESVYTLPVAVARFAGQQVIPFNLILAMSVVSMLPVIIVFLFTQRHVTQGIGTTGLK
jgi:alpha-1,4-digalacturonate transport system permease protein